MSRQATRSLHRCIDAIRHGRWDEARALAEWVIQREPANDEAFSLHGIVLARFAEPELATESLRKALFLRPTEARHAYNLAAHLFALRDFEGARQSVEEALKDQPGHALAQALRDRLYDNELEGDVEFELPRVVVLEDVEDGDAHALVFLRGMERQWTTIGWAFVGLAALAFILGLVFWPITAQDPALVKPGQPTTVLKPGFGPMLAIFLLIVSGIFSFMWVLTDVVDRRSKLIWLIPMVACCACTIHFVPHALYMAMRRRT